MKKYKYEVAVCVNGNEYIHRHHFTHKPIKVDDYTIRMGKIFIKFNEDIESINKIYD